MSTPLTNPTVAETTRLALELHALLAEADEAQWMPSAVVDTGESVSGGSLASRGQHADPTFDTVADGRRLALRAAVLTAESRLNALRSVMAEAASDLQTALDRWNGGN